MRILVTGGAGYIGSHTYVELLKVGVSIKYQLFPPRDGDLPAFWSNPSRVFEKIAWKPQLSVGQMCEDTWAWHKNNTRGYDVDNYIGTKVSNLSLKDKKHAKN